MKTLTPSSEEHYHVMPETREQGTYWRRTRYGALSPEHSWRIRQIELSDTKQTAFRMSDPIVRTSQENAFTCRNLLILYLACSYTRIYTLYYQCPEKAKQPLSFGKNGCLWNCDIVYISGRVSSFARSPTDKTSLNQGNKHPRLIFRYGAGVSTIICYTHSISYCRTGVLTVTQGWHYTPHQTCEKCHSFIKY